jgi:RNA polymerase-binding transcription factor DksA
MAEATAADQRAVLTAERERVTSELAAMGVDRGSYDDGFADSGQVTAERGEVDALVGSLRDTLSDIDEALSKLDKGTYGICEECGQPIGEARLEAMPAARLCIADASARR